MQSIGEGKMVAHMTKWHKIFFGFDNTTMSKCHTGKKNAAAGGLLIFSI